MRFFMQTTMLMWQLCLSPAWVTVNETSTVHYYSSGSRVSREQLHYVAVDRFNPDTFIVAHGDTGLDSVKLLVNGSTRVSSLTPTHSGLKTVTSILQLKESIVLLADSNSHCVRMLDVENGTLSTYAGICDLQGDVDGNLTTARFTHPFDMTMDAQYQTILVSDSEVHKIKVINADENDIQTFASVCLYPKGMLLDSAKRTLYVAVNNGIKVATVENATYATVTAQILHSFISEPYIMAWLDSENFVLAENYNEYILIINLNDSTIFNICQGKNHLLHTANFAPVSFTGNDTACWLAFPEAVVYNDSKLFIGQTQNLTTIPLNNMPNDRSTEWYNLSSLIETCPQVTTLKPTTSHLNSTTVSPTTPAIRSSSKDASTTTDSTARLKTTIAAHTEVDSTTKRSSTASQNKPSNSTTQSVTSHDTGTHSSGAENKATSSKFGSKSPVSLNSVTHSSGAKNNAASSKFGIKSPVSSNSALSIGLGIAGGVVVLALLIGVILFIRRRTGIGAAVSGNGFNDMMSYSRLFEE